jgi:hypothetical protein
LLRTRNYDDVAFSGRGALATNKSKAQLEAELRTLKAARAAEGWVAVLLSLIRWGAIFGISRYAYLAIAALAGKTTLADVGIDFLGKVELSVTLAWLLGVAGCGYGWRQRKLRRDSIERLQRRIQGLERHIDQTRSSSKLTPRGDSRPEDRI